MHVSGLYVQMLILSLVSQSHLRLPTQTVTVLGGTERAPWVFLLPLRAPVTALSLPELPSMLKAKAEIVSG